MQEEFEKYIRENAKAFDQKDLVGNHRERFEQRLKAGNKRKRFRMNNKWVGIAAGVVIILISSLLKESRRSESNHPEWAENEVKSLRDVSTEMEEVELYMTETISEKVMYLESAYPSENDQIQSCLSIVRNLEENYEDLRKELAKSPNEKVVADAMIMNYQTRLDVLEMLIQQLNSNTIDTSTIKNEKNEIHL